MVNNFWRQNEKVKASERLSQRLLYLPAALLLSAGLN